MDPTSVTHIHSITPKIGVLVTGLTADCHAQVQHARYEANDFYFKYSYDILVHMLVKCITDIVQVYTHIASMQLLAIVCLLIGVDDEQSLQMFTVQGIACPFILHLAGKRIWRQLAFWRRRWMI
eukprot:12395839-Ditylum_brightwellii.AAC.1